MFKKYALFVAIGLLINAMGASPIFASSRTDKELQLAAKVRTGIARLGVGEQARVTAKLRDKTEVKGYVYQAGEDDFVVRDAKTGKDTTVAYRDVAAVKGRGLSNGAKIGIGVGIGLAIAVAVTVAASRNAGKFGR